MKLFKFDSDATVVEKIVTVFVPCFVIGVVGFAYLSVWGIFHNFLTKSAATASAGYHTLGTILLLAAGLWFLGGVKDAYPFKINNRAANIVLGLLVAVSLLSYCGFFVGVY